MQATTPAPERKRPSSITPAPERKRRSKNDTDIPIVFTNEKDQINPDTLALLLLSLNTFYKAAEQVLGDISDREFLADQAGFTEQVRRIIQKEYSSKGQLVFNTDAPGFDVISLAYGSKLKLGLRGTVRMMMVVAALTGGKVKTGPFEVDLPGIIPTLQKTYEVVSSGKGFPIVKSIPGQFGSEGKSPGIPFSAGT
jgi:hypothetical protein